MNVSQGSKQINELIILTVLKKEGALLPSQLFEKIQTNGINGINFGNLNKILKGLYDNGVIRKDDGYYAITDFGLNYLDKQKTNFEDIYNFIFKYQIMTHFVGKEKQSKNIKIFNDLYCDCKAIKIVPYTELHFDNEDENTYFNETLPKQDFIYYFDGARGLGRGHFSNYIIAFQNNNMIKFIAILDKYVDTFIDGERVKYMQLKKHSVIKLNNPISVFEIKKNVDLNFKFHRTKQTFNDLEIVGDFIHLFKEHI